MPVLQLGVVELDVALMAAEWTELATSRAEQPRRDLVTILCVVAGVGVATGDGPGRKWCAVLPSPGLYIKLGPCQLALPPPGARWGQAQSSSTYST